MIQVVEVDVEPIFSVCRLRTGGGRFAVGLRPGGGAGSGAGRVRGAGRRRGRRRRRLPAVRRAAGARPRRRRRQQPGVGVFHVQRRPARGRRGAHVPVHAAAAAARRLRRPVSARPPAPEPGGCHGRLASPDAAPRCCSLNDLSLRVTFRLLIWPRLVGFGQPWLGPVGRASSSLAAIYARRIAC